MMKQRLPSLVKFSMSFRFFISLVFCFLAHGVLAKSLGRVEYIGGIDFHKVLDAFSSSVCDSDRFLSVSKALGFSPTWRQFDDDPVNGESPLSDLDSDSLCLISLSSSFKAYRVTRNQDGSHRSAVVGRGDVFPNGARVNRLYFSLPKSPVTEKCVTFGGPLVPYVIIIEKKNGKLVRRIDRTDADEDCFIAALKKKGAIPSKLPVSHK